MKNSINIGRKPTADLNFPDDHHLSNIHAKLCLIDGKVFLEEMGSTNGYLRIFNPIMITFKVHGWDFQKRDSNHKIIN